MSAADIITLPFDADYNAPKGEDNCDQFNAAIPRYFIEEFSKTGERVFDPFIGFGTTAFACEALKRVPYGIEADGERFEWAAGQLAHWHNIRHGDAADTAEFDFPAMDLLRDLTAVYVDER